MSNEALVQRIREQFEQWVVANFPGTPPAVVLSREESGDYSRIGIQGRWEAWQAALSAPEAEAVAWQYRMFIAEGDGDHGWSNWRTCREAFARGKVDDEFYQYRALYLHPAPAHSEQAAVPDGFVLVPKEPTQAMVDAGEGCPQAPWIITSPTSREKELHCITQYRAMLAAAPSAAPAVKESLTVAGDGCAALVTMPIGCAQCGEEHQNNTKEAWAIIQLGCCIKCASRQAEKLAASEARVGELTEALDDYGQHRPACHVHKYPPLQCTCGLDAALSQPSKGKPS